MFQPPLIGAAPRGTEANFYRTSNGHEIDLVLTLPGGTLWAIEIKRSSAPKVERGFHVACEDITPSRRFVVYPGGERYKMDEHTEATGLFTLAQELQGAD